MTVTCPNCGRQFEDGKICPFCNVDTALYAGTVRISEALYNNGLAKIKVSDLSGAIDCLSRSISVNKNNTQARNLLGLVQYEVGHVGEALKNWVISCGLQRGDNPATGYIEIIQKNTPALERLNDAIRIYNQALKDLAQNSDDMALIKLKQAVDLNPKFIDALNLLTLCYLNQNEKARAGAIAERVLAVDNGNTTALSYYNESNPSSRSMAYKAGLIRRRAPAVAASEDRPVISHKKVVLHERRNANFHLEGILAFVIGAICTVGIMYLLVFPAFERSWAAQIEESRSQLTQVEQVHETLIEEKDQEINELYTRISQNEASLDEWARRYDSLERSVQILSAFELFQEGRLREAANAISGIEADGLASDIMERAYEIRSVTYPQLADQYFNEGRTAFYAEDFEKARVDFERAYRFAQYGDPALYSDVIYYLAWTFSLGIDIDQGIHYFERLLEEFPEHNRVTIAQDRLNEISEIIYDEE